MSSLSPQAFVCPECGQRLPTDSDTGQAILESGCPCCCAPVSPGDFDGRP